MANYNKVILIGNLVKDPELRYTPAGAPVTNIRIASNTKYKTSSGEERTETLFIAVVVWGKQAIPCSEFL